MAEPWSGDLWRHTAPNRPPLSGAGARAFGGRWNPPSSVATIYLATTESGCRKELGRLLAGQGSVNVAFPRHLHHVRATDIEAVDLTQPAALEAVGLTRDDLSDDDWSACQAVGDAVHYLGITALLAPSATGDGHVMAVFEPHLRAGQLAVVSTTELPASRS